MDYTLETFTDANTRLWNGGSGTVTLGENITARNLSFSGDGYTIAGGGNTLTLTSAGSGGPGPQTIDVALGTATISAPIVGGNLTKTDGGTLVLTGNNTYTGTTSINGGTLTVSGNGAITQTGTLRNRAAGVTLNVQDNASINALTYMVFGDASGASITINQSGGSVTNQGAINNPAGNSLSNRWGHWSGGANVTYNLSAGTLNLLNAPLYLSWNGAATLNISGDGTANIVGIDMGYGGRTQSSTINLTGGTLNIGSGGIYTGGTANKNINIGGAGGTLRASADFTSSLDMTINGTGNNGAFFDTNGSNIGLSGSLTGTGWLHKIGAGTLTMTGGTHGFGRVNVSNGTLTLTGSPMVAVSTGLHVAVNQYTPVGAASNATLNIDSGSLTAQYIVMGDANGGTALLGTINQTGGTVTTTGATSENNGLRLGHYGVANVTYNLSGGTLTVGDNRDLSAATDGTGWFNQTGGTLNVNRIVVNKRAGTGGSGRVTLAGGTANIGAGGIITDSTPSVATLEYGGLGGTVRATASFSSPLDATLFGTGANAVSFDTNGNTITLSGQLTGAGGLNKIGAGTLAITSTNSDFAGPTTVSAGTLSVSNGRLYDVGWENRSITVTGGATIEVGGWADGDGFGIGRVSFSNVGNILIDDGTIRYTASAYSGQRDRSFTIGAGGATLESAGSIPWVISAERNFPIASNAGGTLTLTGSSDGQIDKAIPGAGDLVKTGTATWTLTANNTYSGNTNVNAGTLALSHASGNNIAGSPVVKVGTGATLDATGLSGGIFAVDAAQVLKGTGTVAGAIGGSGLVSPGNSPGILTADSVNGDSGLDFGFEFTATGDPDYGTPGASVNDVLRLTDADPFPGAPLDGDNVVGIYFDLADIGVGDIFRGGFYTDRDSDFLGDIGGADFQYFIFGDGLGSVPFEGKNYYALGDYLGVLPFSVSTVLAPGGFAAGDYVMQLTAVPEPTSLVLAIVAFVLLVSLGRRSRRVERAAA